MAPRAELVPPPLALYVHLPWCVRKCPYCDFNSHALRGALPEQAYVDALLADLEDDLPRVWGRPVGSVFLGGGTPSLFSAGQMARLLAGIRARLTLAPDAEITLEANPGTVEHDSFAAYREAGINRVSLGVQSFDDACLAAIGRIHGSGEVRQALAALADSGIDNVNIDLMFGLPGQDLADAVRDVEQALAAGPAHLSHYQLTLEPNTEFARRPPPLPDEEACWDMQQACAERLAQGGLRPYEVSAWAQPARQCRHNLNYWRFGDYLGIGAGAHAKLTDAAGGRVYRLAKQRHPKRFLAGPRLAEERALDAPDLVFEYFLNVLRLHEGFSPARFRERTGLAFEVVAERVDQAAELGLLEATGDGWRPSARGRRFSNDLQAMFLP